MNTQLYPIGTVVTLKEATKKLMIIGVLTADTSESKIYDYMGIPYPEGYLDAETMFLFMQDDISDVHFLGYINAEHQAFRAALAKDMEERGVIIRSEEKNG
jgi:hypothetical protein